MRLLEIVSVSRPTSIETEPSKRDTTPEAGKELIPIETALAIGQAKQRLRHLPRFRANVDQAHRSIRKEEQASFEAFARKYRVVCLIRLGTWKGKTFRRHSKGSFRH